MALPTYFNHQLARDTAPLLPGGQFDANPVVLHCSDFGNVTFYFTYKRKVLGGAFTFRIEISHHATVEEWYASSIYAPGLVSVGNVTRSLLQKEEVRYGSSTAQEEFLAYGPVVIVGGVELMRIVAAESGSNLGQPGTLNILAVFSR